jgi:hypothetical protein
MERVGRTILEDIFELIWPDWFSIITGVRPLPRPVRKILL